MGTNDYVIRREIVTKIADKIDEFLHNFDKSEGHNVSYGEMWLAFHLFFSRKIGREVVDRLERQTDVFIVPVGGFPGESSN